MMSTGRIIELVVLIAILVTTIAVVIAIPLSSYNDYKDYLAEIEESKKPEVKPKLESISILLRENVKYYANDMAKADASHFAVIANYVVEGGPSYSEPVAEDQYTVSTALDFYKVGGEITVTYKGKSATVNVELIPLQIESIELVTNPYVTKYQVGSNFKPEGLVIGVTYNDGSKKQITTGYEVDLTKTLTTEDKEMVVSYTEGESTKTLSVPISVTEVLDDGKVVALSADGNAVVQSGSLLANSVVNVSAIYESGNRKPLARTEYTILEDDVTARLGKSYKITLSYNDNPSVSLVTDVIVRSTVQGESCTIVGGKQNTESEFVVVDGNIVPTGNKVTFAGDFAKTILNGGVGYVSFNVTSESASIAAITVRSGNSYCCFANGVNENDGYIMQPLQINTILNLYVNGKAVEIPSNVVLKGSGPSADPAYLFGIYYEFTFENIELEPGNNSVKLEFKKSTNGAVNAWGESPSTINIDYINVDTIGNEIPDDYVIADLEIQESYNISVDQNKSNIKPPVIATLTNGARILAPEMLLDYKVEGGKSGESTIKYGKYTVTVSLKSNPGVKVDKDFEIVGIKVLTAGIEYDNGKVYYVFTGNSYGYEAKDLKFFSDDKEYAAAITFDGTDFVLKVDVTDLKAGTVIYPHLSMKGSLYVNGANANGDIRGTDLKFTDGQEITANGKHYIIRRLYEMPALELAAHKARVDAKFNSDKTLLFPTKTFKYSSSEVNTNGSDANKDYGGGTGNLDKSDRYITYSFSVDKDGYADFVWNIAGVKWNSTTGSNDGINNLGAYVSVTIDGIPVIMEGIQLPAGTSSDPKDIWWNIQKVVIENVELKAGNHTFSCAILTDNGGINVASLELHFKAND